MPEQTKTLTIGASETKEFTLTTEFDDAFGGGTKHLHGITGVGKTGYGTEAFWRLSNDVWDEFSEDTDSMVRIEAPAASTGLSGAVSIMCRKINGVAVSGLTKLIVKNPQGSGITVEFEVVGS